MLYNSEHELGDAATFVILQIPSVDAHADEDFAAVDFEEARMAQEDHRFLIDEQTSGKSP